MGTGTALLLERQRIFRSRDAALDANVGAQLLLVVSAPERPRGAVPDSDGRCVLVTAHTQQCS